MEVLLRPVPHLAYEPVKTDAISCTYDMDGFTLMNVVLIQHGLDREHFRKCAHMHSGGKFRVISHGDEKPLVITTTKTERWDSEPSATQQVIDAADAERCVLISTYQRRANTTTVSATLFASSFALAFSRVFRHQLRMKA